MLQINTEKGLGNIQSKSELSEFELGVLTDHFKRLMAGPPNSQLLQEIIIFYILF